MKAAVPVEPRRTRERNELVRRERESDAKNNRSKTSRTLFEKMKRKNAFKAFLFLKKRTEQTKVMKAQRTRSSRSISIHALLYSN